MGRKVMTWFSMLASLFNTLMIFKPMDAPPPPQKFEQPSLERQDDTLRDHFLIPEEGPHIRPPTLLPPPEIPFIGNQGMWDAANMAIFSRARAYQGYYAPLAVGGIILSDEDLPKILPPDSLLA